MRSSSVPITNRFTHGTRPCLHVHVPGGPRRFHIWSAHSGLSHSDCFPRMWSPILPCHLQPVAAAEENLVRAGGGAAIEALQVVAEAKVDALIVQDIGLALLCRATRINRCHCESVRSRQSVLQTSDIWWFDHLTECSRTFPVSF